jgi:hypothetical protein
MSWVFTRLSRELRRVRDLEREQVRRLKEAYARWDKRRRGERDSRDPEQERRLHGSQAAEHKERRER